MPCIFSLCGAKRVENTDRFPKKAGQFARVSAGVFPCGLFCRLMAVDQRLRAAPGFAMWISDKIDLKLRLSLQVAALAALCFSAASAYALFESNRSAQTKAAWTAAIVAKDIELQQDQMHWVKVKALTTPDLQTIAGPLMAPGLCIAYRARNGATLQSLCSGAQPDETDSRLGSRLCIAASSVPAPRSFTRSCQGARFSVRLSSASIQTASLDKAGARPAGCSP
jgi:hypothetical protein